MVLAGLLALLIGLSLGMLGGGGSVLAVPVFTYVLGYPAKVAVAMALLVVAIASAVGMVRHARLGHVDGRVLVAFAPLSMAGAYLGARLAWRLADAVQLALFGVVALVAAGYMARPRPGAPGVAGAVGPARTGAGSIASLGAVAFGVGLVIGVVGVGGGFLLVPALVAFGRLPMPRAVATSLAIIALNAGAGFLGYVGRVPLDLGVMAAFTAVAVAGAVVGAQLAHRVAPATLRRAFAVLLVGVAGAVLWQNCGVVRSAASAAVARPAAETPRPHSTTTTRAESR